ncbi:MAG TPA: COX15/CtaA family protein [Acidiferrobacteraceae bacterium]|nr:COX15/CtaA family protein [Acidiferrobacteraceae bacterium]
MTDKQQMFFRLALVAFVLAYAVVLMGAFTRIENAGLGCPDWPGCYGRVFAPTTPAQVEHAQHFAPQADISPAKAWKEMIHRYMAGLLSIAILAMAVVGMQLQRRTHRARYLLPLVAVVLLVFQALLGMLTVTWKLNPLIVMGHLLGGLSILSLLWWIILREQRLFRSKPSTPLTRRLRWLALLALVIVIAQIALGGWTSSNYAGLACPDFPTCQAQWWPQMDFTSGFTLWHKLGVDYDGGVLSLAAATAVHMAHRLGALVTFVYVGGLALYIIVAGGQDRLCRYGVLLLVALLIQVTLGILNVLTHLTVPIAEAHNGFAGFLLLSVLLLNHVVRPGAAAEAQS